VQTVIPFHRLVMDNQKFNSGDLYTHFIEEEFSSKMEHSSTDETSLKAMAVLSCLVDYESKHKSIISAKDKSIPKTSVWKYCGRRNSVGR